MLLLQVIEGPDHGRVFPLPDGEPQLIGRSTEAYPLTDLSISRRHAELTPDGSSWLLRDLDSANGTYLNGDRIRSRVVLSSGDRIRCGSTVFRLIEGTHDVGGPSGTIDQDRLVSVGRTVASISHAIKNILQGLRGGASAVELGIQRGDLEMAREGWPILSRNLDRIYDLTFNMLAYSRTRSLEPDTHDLAQIVQDVVVLVEPVAHRKKVRLASECPSGMDPITCDANALHQALLNLMLNAVEAVESKSGRVGIRTRSDARGIWIEVTDNGPGIDPGRREEVFRPFASTKGQRGTGLGLPVTRRIIEDHGGEISLHDGEDGGCRFRIRLPGHGIDDPGRTRVPSTDDPPPPLPMEHPPDLSDEFD
ncbi:MAG: ATP-binding protein [Planctomycetota bacterium]|nr:ATP-binding protein [Planctomycetota bacterium]